MPLEIWTKSVFHANNLKRYSLGTKNKNLRRNADGSLTLYADVKSPGGDKESNWLPASRWTALRPGVLGKGRYPRRLVEAAGHSKGRLDQRWDVSC